MGSAPEVLVVILSIFLAIFLILAIVLIVLLIRVTKQIKSVTSVAKSAADNVNNIMATASKVAAPTITARYIAEQAAKFIKNQRNRK